MIRAPEQSSGRHPDRRPKPLPDDSEGRRGRGPGVRSQAVGRRPNALCCRHFGSLAVSQAWVLPSDGKAIKSFGANDLAEPGGAFGHDRHPAPIRPLTPGSLAQLSGGARDKRLPRARGRAGLGFAIGIPNEPQLRTPNENPHLRGPRCSTPRRLRRTTVVVPRLHLRRLYLRRPHHFQRHGHRASGRHDVRRELGARRANQRVAVARGQRIAVERALDDLVNYGSRLDCLSQQWYRLTKEMPCGIAAGR